MAEDNFNIRAMDFDDLEEVVHLEKDCFSEPWSLDTFCYEITKNPMASYVVAEEKGNDRKIVGYAGMWIIGDEAHITNVAVLGEYRGKKLGEKLMNRQIKDSVIAGAVKMTLEARVSNVIAISLYNKLGFKEVGIRRRYYQDNDEDAVIMWKNYEEE